MHCRSYVSETKWVGFRNENSLRYGHVYVARKFSPPGCICLLLSPLLGKKFCSALVARLVGYYTLVWIFRSIIIMIVQYILILVAQIYPQYFVYFLWKSQCWYTVLSKSEGKDM